MTGPIVYRAAANEQEVIEGFDLMARMFGPNYFDAQANFARALKFDPPRALDDVFVAVRGGRIVGAVRYVRRTFVWNQLRLPVGYGTILGVHPSVRGKGVSRKLTEMILEQLRARGDALSLNFARRAIDGFYTRFGFVGLGIHPELRVPITQPPPQRKDVRWRVGFGPAVSKGCERAYNATFRNLPMHSFRDASWWSRLPALLRDRGLSKGFVIAVRGNQTVGYLVQQEDRIVEAAALPGEAQLMADAVFARAAAQRRPELVLALHPANPIAQSLRRRDHILSVRQSWGGGHMVRVINKAAVRPLVGDGPGAADRRALFDKLDLDQPEEARRLVLLLVGTAHGVPSPEAMPCWSALDGA